MNVDGYKQSVACRHHPSPPGQRAAILNAEQITYPPLDTLKPVTNGVWIVDSGPIAAMGFVQLPIRMTVLRLNDGSLMLHSPTRFTATLKQELEQVGLIAHLVAPNSAHWMFVKEWQTAAPPSAHGQLPDFTDAARCAAWAYTSITKCKTAR